MKLFAGDRYQLSPKKEDGESAEGLCALGDGVELMPTGPVHVASVPPGGEYPQAPKYEAFHWLNPAYSDLNARSVNQLAEHFGFSATLIKRDPIQLGDEVAAYGFSREEAEAEWRNAANAQGWQPVAVPGAAPLTLTEVEQARSRPNAAVWRASAVVIPTT